MQSEGTLYDLLLIYNHFNSICFHCKIFFVQMCSVIGTLGFLVSRFWLSFPLSALRSALLCCSAFWSVLQFWLILLWFWMLDFWVWQFFRIRHFRNNSWIPRSTLYLHRLLHTGNLFLLAFVYLLTFHLCKLSHGLFFFSSFSLLGTQIRMVSVTWVNTELHTCFCLCLWSKPAVYTEYDILMVKHYNLDPFIYWVSFC